MSYEVDFLPVGDGERCGDAIAFRWRRDPSGSEQVVVIDGGTLQSGEQLVRHIRHYYGTNTVDNVILTHPDLDHASGLRVVLDEMQVGQLVMHLPWEHSTAIAGLWHNGRFVSTNLDQRLRKTLECARELETTAKRRGIPIHEPFEGHQSGTGLLVLGPSRTYYESLVPSLLEPPAVPWSLADLLGSLAPPKTQSPYSSLATLLPRTTSGGVDYVPELPWMDLLDDSGTTTARNSSSAIILLQLSGQKLLFTGDAGIEALTRAVDFAESCGITLRDLTFLHVPHHGSRRNLGPGILKRLGARIAYISAAADSSPKHPSRRVVNALTRRRTSVYATQGRVLRFGVGLRPGWDAVEPLPWYSQVEI